MSTLTPTPTPTVPATSERLSEWLCRHPERCPTAGSPDRGAAAVLAAHPEQGWTLLCNGLVVFDDTGDLLPDGQIIGPHRFEAARANRAATA